MAGRSCRPGPKQRDPALANGAPAIARANRAHRPTCRKSGVVPARPSPCTVPAPPLIPQRFENPPCLPNPSSPPHPPRLSGHGGGVRTPAVRSASGGIVVPAQDWQQIERSTVCSPASTPCTQSRHRNRAGARERPCRRFRRRARAKRATADGRTTGRTERAPRARPWRSRQPRHRTRVRHRRAHRARFRSARSVPPLVMQRGRSRAGRTIPDDPRASFRARKVNAGLGAVRQAHPAVGVIELVDDDSLDRLSCVVVSEAGEVRAGIAQQIEAIRTALAGVLAARPDEPRHSPVSQQDPAMAGLTIRCWVRWPGAVDRARRPRRRSPWHADPRHRIEGRDRRTVRTAQSARRWRS